MNHRLDHSPVARSRLWLFTAMLLGAASINTLLTPEARAAAVPGQGSWETSLEARDWAGNGAGIDAYYDNVLNITWLADANYARAAGLSANGAVPFATASAWVAGLDLLGMSDWRLPSVSPVDGVAFNTSFSNNGSTDRGGAATGTGWGTASELGYMFYVHLANLGFFQPNDLAPAAQAQQAGWTAAPSNTGPFANIVSTYYWTGTPYPSGSAVWTLGFSTGDQINRNTSGNNGMVWLVHDGDPLGVTVIPVPGALALAAGPLLVLGAGLRRRAACSPGPGTPS